MRSRLPVFLFALCAVLIVAVDQITKLLVLDRIPLGDVIKVIPGWFHLTYVQNTGAAFSSFRGMRWMFVGTFINIDLRLPFIVVFKEVSLKL